MQLRGDGLIKLERNLCTIPDLGRLKDAAMFDPTYLHLKSAAPPRACSCSEGAQLAGKNAISNQRAALRSA
jgi:hypothetical protein